MIMNRFEESEAPMIEKKESPTFMFEGTCCRRTVKVIMKSSTYQMMLQMFPILVELKRACRKIAWAMREMQKRYSQKKMTVKDEEENTVNLRIRTIKAVMMK